MPSSSRPVRLLAGIGLVIVGLLAGVLLMLVMETDEREVPTARVVKQAEPSSKATARPAAQTDSSPSAEVPSPVALNQLFREVAGRVTDAVVSIQVQSAQDDGSSGGGRDLFSPPARPRNLGSGVLISPDGYVITNRHVVSDADRIEVTLADKRQFEATVVGTDASTDLAVVKIDAPSDFPVLPLGRSDRVEVGDWVVAIGNPFRLTSTVTAGIVSALDRQLNIIEDQFRVESFIQTDAAINPGNSGGALVNMQGKLVGINTAIASGTGAYEGYGFAIPAALVERVATDLIRYGEVRRGYLGVQIAGVDARVADEIGLDEIRGVYVDGVRSRGGADRGGLQAGDVIVAVEGRTVNSPGELQSTIALQRPGDVVSVRLWRDGTERTADVKLMGEDTPAYQDWLSDLQSGAPSDILPAPERPQEGGGSDTAVLEINEWGVGLRDVDARVASRFGVDTGAYVAYVEQGDTASENGLPRDVVITALDGTSVDAPEAVETYLAGKAEAVVLVEVQRADGTKAFYELE